MSHPRTTPTDAPWMELLACRSFLEAAERLAVYLASEPDARWAFVLPLHPSDGRFTGYEARSRGEERPVATRWVVDPVADGGPLSEVARCGEARVFTDARELHEHAPATPVTVIPLRLPDATLDALDCPRFDCLERRGRTGACGVGSLPDTWTRDAATCGLLPVVGVIGVAGAGEAARLAARVRQASKIAPLFGNFRLREALSDAEYFREDILDSMTEAILAVGLGGDVLLMNRAAEELCGMARHEAVGADVGRVLVEVGRSVVTEMTHARGRSAREREARLRRRDGSEVDVLVHSAAITTRGWGRRGTLLSLVDRTAVKAMEGEIRRLDRLATVGRFTSAVAHEVRNPLAGILAGVQVLGSQLPDDPETARHLSFIEGEVARLDRIVGDLQTATRPREPQPRWTRAADIFADVEAALSPAAAAAGVTMEFRDEVDSLRVDPELIHQVLLNLVKNAIDASDRGARVRVVAATAEPGGVRIDVVDSGPGVPEPLRADIFEPFMTTKDAGAGLGLYISHAIAARHGGRLEITASSPAGTTFRLWLPSGAPAEGSAT